MSNEASLSPEVLARIDAACERFEIAWHLGQPRLEEFLTEATVAEQSIWLRGLLEIEIEVLRNRDLALRVEDYLDRFPGQEGVVRMAFDPDARLFGGGTSRNRLAATLISDSGVSNPRAASVLPAAGQVFGRYEIRRELGAGAMGSVFLAYDPQLQRQVALKVPKWHYVVKADGKDRFLREARSAAGLQHRHLCPVYDVGEADGLPYITMAYLSGEPLSSLVGKQLPPEQIARLVVKICQGLEHAHCQGIVHRDLKPSNVMFDAEGEPVVTDFGLACTEGGRDATVTSEGEVVGSPAYMSPEQARGHARDADPRMDVYSIGVILFQLLTGDLPFRGDWQMTLRQVVNDEPPNPRKLNHRVPLDLDTICLKCLSKERSGRYASAHDLASDLQRYLDGRPIFARPAGRIERAWRWCKRSPIIALLTVGLTAALVVGTTVSLFFAMRAHEQKAEAEDLARQLSQFIEVQLVAALHNPIDFELFRPRRKRAESPELVRLATQNLSRTRHLEQPRKAKADALSAMGTIFRAIGEYDLAIEYLGNAIEIQRRLGSTEQRALANSLLQYGWLQREKKHYPEAEAALREALTLNDGNQADRRFYAITEFYLALILAERGSQEDPKLLKESLNRFRAIAEQVKTITGEKSRDYAVILMGLAIAYFANGDDMNALVAAATSQQHFLFDKSESLEPASKVFSLYSSISIFRKEGKLVQAEKSFRQAIDLAEELVDEQHPFFSIPVAFLKADFAGLLRDMRKDVEAEKVSREALGVLRSSPVRGHVEVIRALIQFADRMRGRGHPEDLKEAAELYVDAIQFGSVSLGVNHQFVTDARKKLESLRKSDIR